MPHLLNMMPKWAVSVRKGPSQNEILDERYRWSWLRKKVERWGIII